MSVEVVKDKGGSVWKKFNSLFTPVKKYKDPIVKSETVSVVDEQTSRPRTRTSSSVNSHPYALNDYVASLINY